MSVQPGGSLSAVGTAADEITFTGTNKNPGSWAGLVFDNCNNSDTNRLVYCNIEYGGSSSTNEWNNASLSITGTSATPTAIGEISNCEDIRFELLRNRYHPVQFD